MTHGFENNKKDIENSDHDKVYDDNDNKDENDNDDDSDDDDDDDDIIKIWSLSRQRLRSER